MSDVNTEFLDEGGPPVCHAFMGAAESVRPTLSTTLPFEDAAFSAPFEVYGPLRCFLVGPVPRCIVSI